jgi:hypothetical protein
VHPRLLVGKPCRVGQIALPSRIQQCASHHRDGRPTRDAIALPKMKGGKFHRPSR